MASYDEIVTLAFAARPQIGPIRLNCTTTETHSLRSIITEAPVEAGADRAQHKILQPRYLALEGVISDRPDNIVDQEWGSIPAAILALLPTFNLATTQGAQFGGQIAADPGLVGITAGANAAVVGGAAAAGLYLRNKRDRQRALSKYSYKDDADTSWSRIKTLWASSEPFTIMTALDTYNDMVIESIDVPEDDTSDLVFRAVFREFQTVGVRRLRYLSEDFADEGSLPDTTAGKGPREVELPAFLTPIVDGVSGLLG